MSGLFSPKLLNEIRRQKEAAEQEKWVGITPEELAQTVVTAPVVDDIADATLQERQEQFDLAQQRHDQRLAADERRARSLQAAADLEAVRNRHAAELQNHIDNVNSILAEGGDIEGEQNNE